LLPLSATSVQAAIVTGCVFHDANGNGQREPTESGIEGVIVSDGVDSVLTGSDGSYVLPNTDPEWSHFVFVVSPTGYKCVGKFYRRVQSDVKESSADFALAPAPESVDPDFSFAHTADLHVTSGLLDDLKVIEGFKPAFTIATGDLVDSRTGYPRHVEVMRRISAPLYNAHGNHDLPVAD